MKPTFWGGFCLLLIVLACLTLAGCSSPRYLTEQEDREMGEKCRETGCVAVPIPLYRQIIEYIKRSNSA